MNEIKLICLYGPESTGKSTMCKYLADVYKTEFVPEVAKEFITSNNFSVEDIINIGIAQTERVKKKLKTANRFLFCDTDVITTQIYSQYYLGLIPPILYELEKEIKYDQYFILDIDVPWIPDGIRDLQNKRDNMIHIFEEELRKRNISSIKVSGSWKEREDSIINQLNRI